jgi:hypothetical protein
MLLTELSGPVWAHLANETQGGTLDLHHGDQTHSHLQLHGLASESQICQQEEVQYATEICLSGCNRVMKTSPITLVEVLLGLLPLHVMLEAEALAGIHTLMCNQQ